MNARTLLADVVTQLRAIPPTLSGDSDLADAWEEIKYQVQGELSFLWLLYLDTIKGAIDSALARLRPEELSDLSAELRAPREDGSKIRRALLLRLLARARKEKVRYEPFDFEYFWYSYGEISIYNRIIKRTGMHTCWVLAHSPAIVSGEQGEIDLAAIDRRTDINIMTADEFEEARRLNWPHIASKQPVTHNQAQQVHD